MILIGDNLDIMRSLPNGCVNLIMTSPPYADARKKTYGGVKPDDYVEWFLPRAAEMQRVLAEDGSFVLNIKEGTKDGQKLTYAIRLVLALQESRWLWTEEYIWHKDTSVPGKWTNRFRDAWEHCYHFTKQKKFKMNQEAVMLPSTDTKKRNENGQTRQDMTTGSGFGGTRVNMINRLMVYPSNVLYGSPVRNNKGHSAVYPEWLPEFFIKLFTDPHDLVLDPFVGSGTTCHVAERLNRNAIGIDLIDPTSLG